MLLTMLLTTAILIYGEHLAQMILVIFQIFLIGTIVLILQDQVI